ncbi:hypothetical protein IW262DRAFT_1521349, partial [Armillaria fumosa]
VVAFLVNSDARYSFALFYCRRTSSSRVCSVYRDSIYHRFMNTKATSVVFYRQAQAELAKMGIYDLQFDCWIEVCQAELDKNSWTALEKSKTDLYYQMWKSTKDHRSPLQAPMPPCGRRGIVDGMRTHSYRVQADMMRR